MGYDGWPGKRPKALMAIALSPTKAPLARYALGEHLDNTLLHMIAREHLLELLNAYHVPTIGSVGFLDGLTSQWT